MWRPAESIFHARKHGFDYLGMRTIVTDVVRENNQTYRLGWTEMSKDATKMGSGSPEYVLLFHKPQSDRNRGYADVPVTKNKAEYSRSRWQVDAHAFWRSSGNRHLTPDELAHLPPEQMSRLFTEQTLREVYDYESHVRIGEQLDGRGALPATFMSLAPGSWHPEVWHDINRMLTLNTEQSRRAQTMHLCPLQVDLVDRLVRLYSNPGDLVYDPFAGLGTVPVRALKLGRRGRGVELNPGYFLGLGEVPRGRGTQQGGICRRCSTWSRPRTARRERRPDHPEHRRQLVGRSVGAGLRGRDRPPTECRVLRQ